MSLEVVEMVVKCQVPREESEEFVTRLRNGERLLEVANGFTCADAFDTFEWPDGHNTIIRIGYRPSFTFTTTSAVKDPR
jgi:hypothetical protein